MKSKTFDENVFLTDLLRIERFYQQEGYLQARVKNFEQERSPKGDEVNLKIYIDEGQATKVNQVRVLYEVDSEHLEPPEKIAKMLRLKKGKRYREEDLKLDYNKIVERFSSRGFPYIRARVKPVIDKENHLVDLEWQLQPGPYCFFGEIVVKYLGHAGVPEEEEHEKGHVSDKVIHRGLGFRTGQPFNQKKLLNAQSEVYRLELFQFVGLRANFENRPQNIPIEVRINETKFRTLKFGAGIGTQEGIRGFVNWRHRNFLGGARTLTLEAKTATKILPLEIKLGLRQPYFFSNRNDLLINPFFIWQDEQSFDVKRLGLETTVNRRFGQKSSLFISTIIERDSVEINGPTGDLEIDQLYNKTIIRFGLTRDTSDEFFNPSRGRKYIIVVEEAGRFLNLKLLNTPFSYLKAYTDQRFYKRLGRKSVLASRFLIGVMNRIYSSKTTPVEERFFSGGTNSVRGWGRQLLGPTERVAVNDSTSILRLTGGNSIIEGSFEWRRNLFGQFSGAVFLDYGNVWRDWDGFDLFDLRYAIGASLRYNTPIGPVRVDFGWKVNKQPHDDSNYQIHISIGQPF